MKSSIGFRRKARKILVNEDVDVNDLDRETENNNSLHTDTRPTHNLNQDLVIDFTEDDRLEIGVEDNSEKLEKKKNVSNLTSKKLSRTLTKKNISSRLSFQVGDLLTGDEAEALEDKINTLPIKTALKPRDIGRNQVHGIPTNQSLPRQPGNDDEGRQCYSKEYLNELKNLTPVAPKDLCSNHTLTEHKDEIFTAGTDEQMAVMAHNIPAIIPSQAEIQEKKDRRARLAIEKDFISLEPQTDQERQARRRQLKEMAELIEQAECSSDETSDDSEVERCTAYERAQTRAGMDGLHKPDFDEDRSTTQIPRITPLPIFSECFERLKNKIQSTETGLSELRKKLQDSEQEQREITAREVEVQGLLKQAGERFTALTTSADPITLQYPDPHETTSLS
ncbi:BgTH12-01762 [Blumeria graminis f. sp. triticale]|uniref:BgTH12-01762 n=1 Tax=Blumeria graminis f. sp. triticale TaxID=1689686 RepID=A0A9W4D558_BLUGR|nr:BgTH12-01762 [Blumeria graminis f. sp. triticale]